MKKKILITGSESFIGKQLIEKLKNTYNIIGIDLKKKSKNTTYIGNIAKFNFLKLKKKKIDYIIHLAAVSNSRDCKKSPLKCFETNVLGTLKLIEFANKNKIKNFIFASTQWVYNFYNSKTFENEKSSINILDMSTEYGLSKAVSETNLKHNFKQNNLNTTILRFGIIYGERKNNFSAVESLFLKVKKEKFVTVGNKNTGRNFIHVEDVCEAIIKSIKSTGFNIYGVEGDNLVTLNDIIKYSSKILGKKTIIKSSKYEKPNIRNVSNKKIKKDLKWYPKISISKGLERLNKFL